VSLIFRVSVAEFEKDEVDEASDFFCLVAGFFCFSCRHIVNASSGLLAEVDEVLYEEVLITFDFRFFVIHVYLLSTSL